MNVLNIALSSITNLVSNQSIQIKNAGYEIVNGVSRPLDDSLIEAKAHMQPLTAQELRQIQDGFFSSQEFYRLWIIGDNLDLVKFALNQNKESVIIWNNREYKVYSKQDWSLNGWIEVTIALKGKSNA